MKWAIDLAERRVIPDPVVRAFMRMVIGQRLQSEKAPDMERTRLRLQQFTDELSSGPIAIATDDANRQHYELPAEFFETVLGPHLKYSSCLWPEGVTDLAEAEEEMLALCVDRAGIMDGMEVLDLGCGWGSMALWIAAKFPRARVVAVSNSRTQAEFIRRRCTERGIDRVEVLTADMNEFSSARRFDRIVSVEMFEHMQNWDRLFSRVSNWLEPAGRFFLHVFCNRRYAYRFVDSGSSDWMARHFFSGGIMPSEDFPRRFGRHLEVIDQWRVDGLHYSRTLEAWLRAMDANRQRLIPLFRDTYGDQAERWFARWRMFFMACSELFGYRHGMEWYVSHTLLKPRFSEAGRV